MTKTASQKRDGVRANNRPSFYQSLADEDFRRVATAAIRLMRTSVRQDGGTTYDVVQMVDSYLKSHGVNAWVRWGTLALPSGRLIMEHYWIEDIVSEIIVDPTVDKFRNELSLDIGYFSKDSADGMRRRYFEQKLDDEDAERDRVKKQAVKHGLFTSAI